MRRFATLMVALMLVVGIISAAALTGSSSDDPSGSQTERPAATPAESRTASPAASIQRIDSLAYGEPESGSPTNRTGQSRLWFHDDTWWGVLLVAESGDHRIHRLDAAAGQWVDLGVIVDDRVFARMDVLWDGEHLVVASAGTQPDDRHALRIVRYTYEDDSGSYLRDPNFPIPITDGGVESVTVARSVDGRLWVAYRTGESVAVDHSLDTDLAWRGPFVPEAAFGDVDQAAIVAAGDHVALVWTKSTESEVYVAWNDATQPSDLWTFSSPAAVADLQWGEDAMSVIADDTSTRPRVLAAVQTSADDSPTRGSQDPQIVVSEFVLGEEPKVHLVSRVDDRHGPPAIVLDRSAQRLYVITSTPAVGGTIVYKVSPLEDIRFTTGGGRPLIERTQELPRIGNPSSTKQPLTEDSGLLIVATDTRAGRYAFGGIDIPRVPTAPIDPASSGADRTIVDQDFDGLAIGSAVRGWELEGPPFPSFAVRVLTGTNSSAHLSTVPGGTRACIPLRYMGTGRVSVEWRFLFNLALSEELRPLQVRGEGELASLRVRDDELRYFDGSTLVRQDIVLQPGRWYRVAMELDAAAGTYDLVVRGPAEEVLLEDADLGWRSVGSTDIGRICAELPDQPGVDLYLDDVVVTVHEEES